MKRALEKCGFSEVKEMKPGETSEQKLKKYFLMLKQAMKI